MGGIRTSRPAVPYTRGTRATNDPSPGLFRALAARSRDVIYRYRLLPTPGFDHILKPRALKAV